MTYRVILFDLDGVLVSSKAAWFSLMQEVGVTFRGRPISWEEFEPTFGQSTSADVETFGLGVTPEELDLHYASHFGRHLSRLDVDPAAAPLLAALRDRGMKLGVVTNTVTPLAIEILTAAGLSAFASVVLGPGEGRRGKPAKDLLVAALSALRAKPEEALLVGDSVYDRGAAAASGVRFIGLGIDGDERIERLSDLLGVLPSEVFS